MSRTTTFNINLLSGLDYDEAEPLLESYTAEIIKLFKVSPEGIACFKKYRNEEWYIELLIDFGIGYDGVSLPEMALSDVRYIMEDLFPRKVTVRTRKEAAAIVPVLKAFWSFLERKFSLQHAPEINNYLSQLQPSFPSMMMDTSRFGMAKSFLVG